MGVLFLTMIVLTFIRETSSTKMKIYSPTRDDNEVVCGVLTQSATTRRVARRIERYATGYGYYGETGAKRIHPCPAHWATLRGEDGWLFAGCEISGFGFCAAPKAFKLQAIADSATQHTCAEFKETRHYKTTCAPKLAVTAAEVAATREDEPEPEEPEPGPIVRVVPPADPRPLGSRPAAYGASGLSKALDKAGKTGAELDRAARPVIDRVESRMDAHLGYNNLDFSEFDYGANRLYDEALLNLAVAEKEFGVARDLARRRRERMEARKVRRSRKWKW